jgi:hypothetical protein
MTAAKPCSKKPVPVKKGFDTKPSLTLTDYINYIAPVSPRDEAAGLRRQAEFSNRALKRKQRVQFAPTASVVARIASLEDLENSWYRHEDYSSFETECRRTLATVRMAKIKSRSGDDQYELNSTEFTTSGLEDFLSPHRKNLRHYRKMCHNHNVLMHQFMQRCRGVQSPEYLKIASEISSYESSELAFQRGTRKSLND